MAKILVIEDDADVRAAIQTGLIKAGYSVLSAAHGKEGINILRQNTVELVITDIFMPEQEGLETITALRKQYPQLPVIAISGGNVVSREMLSVARELGAQEVIEKPFGLTSLLAAVDKALGNGEK